MPAGAVSTTNEKGENPCERIPRVDDETTNPARQPPAADDNVKFLAGGGEMTKLVRTLDWGQTSLGPIEQWPQSLRTAASLCLASNFPINLIWGPERVQIYNDGYWPICGAKHPLSMGQDFKECWASAWPAIGEPLERASGGEAAFIENERMFLDRNGYLEETFFTFSFSPIRDESGAVAGLFHPVTELTQQTLAERRLRILQDIADRSGEAHSVLAACELTAKTLADHQRDVPFALLYLADAGGKQLKLAGLAGLPRGAPCCAETLDPSVDADQTWPLERVMRGRERVLVKDLRSRFGEFSCGPYPEPPNDAFVLPISVSGLDHPIGVLIAGVSPRRAIDKPYRGFYRVIQTAVTTVFANAHAYEEERKRAESLAELDQAKTAFFSNVSHEFRTPLTLMLGPTQEALASPGRSLTGENLEVVHRNELRLLKLVNTLLEFSRIEAGRRDADFEPTDLAQFTADLVGSFRSAFSHAGLTFFVECRSLSQPIFVDREMWEKIVLNLLSNALKFTFEGSVQVSLVEFPGKVELRVSDTGTGIPDEELPHLFDRFHRVKGARSRSHEGSGIGLALVSELVKMHGGRMEATSKLDKGTTFIVTIPTGHLHLRAEYVRQAPTRPQGKGTPELYVTEALRWLPDGEAATVAGHLEEPTKAPSESKRILLADDNADMREYVTRLLSDRWIIEAYPDGAQALAAARKAPPALVIADIMMPKLDGLELLRELQDSETTARIPVIFLSARAGEEARVEGLEAGAADYLVKPFSARELRARVETQILRSEIRAARLLHDRRLADIFQQAPVGIAILRGPEHVFDFVNETYSELVGDRRAIVGKPILAALPEIADQGVKELLDEVRRSRKPFTADSFRILLNRGVDGASEEFFF